MGDLDLAAEVERLRVELRRAAMYERLYFEVQEVLDGALGVEEDDGAGAGIVADVALVVQHRDEARTEAAALIAEVDQLRAALADEQATHAKTFDNFEAFVESMTEQRNTLADERDRLQREVEGLRAWRDGNHDEHRQLRAEVEQWRATYGESALRDATAVIEERDRLRTEVKAKGCESCEPHGGCGG